MGGANRQVWGILRASSALSEAERVAGPTPAQSLKVKGEKEDGRHNISKALVDSNSDLLDHSSNSIMYSGESFVKKRRGTKNGYERGL